VKIKVLIGILVALIVLNLATIGSFLFMKWRGPDDGIVPRAPISPSMVHPRQGGTPRTPRPPPLPNEERKQMMSLLAEFRTETEGLRIQIQELENRVFELMRRDEVPRDEVDSLLAEISDARLEVGRLAIDKLIESKTYLSPQQQEHFFRSILETRTGRSRGMGRHEGTHRGEDRQKQRRGNRL